MSKSAWLYRWPNGDSSIVFARNRGEALYILDEVGGPDPKNLYPLPSGAVHFYLSESGDVEFEQFSEEVQEIVDKKAYPLIAAILNDPKWGCGKRSRKETAALKGAAALEKKRVRDPESEPGPPLTDTMGKFLTGRIQ